jgi:hypothetical protein
VRGDSLPDRRGSPVALCVPLYGLSAAYGFSLWPLDDRSERGTPPARGAPEAYAVTLPEGVKRHGRFCGECATRLWGEPARFPQVFILRPGTLDDTSWLDPVGHIWVRSKQAWVQIPDGAVTFEAQPEDPMALIKAWRERAPRA